VAGHITAKLCFCYSMITVCVCVCVCLCVRVWYDDGLPYVMN
jgi:hypothetical protein